MIKPLDLNGPLTGGTVVLEASAGTGKTYALSHRAVSYTHLTLPTILRV